MILWETAHSWHWHWAPDERWIVADRRWNGIGKLQSSHSFILVYCFCRRSIDAGNTIQSTLIYLSSIDWIRHSFYTCWAMQFAFWIEFNERLTNKTHIYESDSCSPHRNSNTSPQRHASPRFHVLFFFSFNSLIMNRNRNASESHKNTVLDAWIKWAKWRGMKSEIVFSRFPSCSFKSD